MKTYYVRFGTGDPRPNTGLSPTFLIFNNYGTGVTPPGITSVIGATGIYAFQYGVTTPIAFLIDGATTGLSDAQRYVTGAIDPADRADEYGSTLTAIGTTSIALGTTNVALGTTAIALGTTNVVIGTTLTAIGTTLIAIGQSNIAIGTTIYVISVTLAAIGNTLSVLPPFVGTTLSSYGTNSADPNDLFGYLKRIQENLEGNQNFTKSSGSLGIYTRGSSQLLVTKTITNSASMVIKT